MRRRIAFHPLSVAAASLAAALFFAGWVTLRFDGDMRFFLLYYFTPVGVPFVAFLLDRWERWPQRAVDAAVVAASLTRAVILVPLVSGHALFLTYAILTSRSPVARATAGLVLLQVIYLKIFAWRDAALLGGALLGGVAALLFARWGNRGRIGLGAVETVMPDPVP